MNAKMILTMTAAVAAAYVCAAAPKIQRGSGRNAAAAAAAATADETNGKGPKVKIDTFPRMGASCKLSAPSIPGGSSIGPVFTKKRDWIVLEAKYQTYLKRIEQLTFTWHVVLETKTATTKDKEARAKMAPYSYFTQTTTYYNIPRGTHAASVCLHPSYLEQYGEPRAVGLVITDSDGNVLAGDVDSQIEGIVAHPKTIEKAFWNDPDVMNKKDANGDPLMEQRQGLLDRSKTIWALVNPNDYELVLQ